MKHEPDDVRKNALHAVAVHYIGFRSAWIGYGLFVFINNLSVEEKQNQYRDNNRYDVGSPNLNNNNNSVTIQIIIFTNIGKYTHTQMYGWSM